jgi:hypothetical protein
MLKKIAAVLALGVVLGGAAVSEASPVRGRGTDFKTVAAYGTVTYYEELYGNEKTFIDVIGSKNTTLDVEIYNMAGQRVFRTFGPGDNFRFSFTPAQRGTYRIVVINRGGASNTYSLVVE